MRKSHFSNIAIYFGLGLIAGMSLQASDIEANRKAFSVATNPDDISGSWSCRLDEIGKPSLMFALRLSINPEHEYSWLSKIVFQQKEMKMGFVSIARSQEEEFKGQIESLLMAPLRKDEPSIPFHEYGSTYIANFRKTADGLIAELRHFTTEVEASTCFSAVKPNFPLAGYIKCIPRSDDGIFQNDDKEHCVIF